MTSPAKHAVIDLHNDYPGVRVWPRFHHDSPVGEALTVRLQSSCVSVTVSTGAVKEVITAC